MPGALLTGAAPGSLPGPPDGGRDGGRDGPCAPPLVGWSLPPGRPHGNRVRRRLGSGLVRGGGRRGCAGRCLENRDSQQQNGPLRAPLLCLLPPDHTAQSPSPGGAGPRGACLGQNLAGSGRDAGPNLPRVRRFRPGAQVRPTGEPEPPPHPPPPIPSWSVLRFVPAGETEAQGPLQGSLRARAELLQNQRRVSGGLTGCLYHQRNEEANSGASGCAAGPTGLPPALSYHPSLHGLALRRPVETWCGPHVSLRTFP